MTIKDLVSASNNSSALYLEVFQNGDKLSYRGSADGLYSIMQDWEIDTIVVKGGEQYREVYVK